MVVIDKQALTVLMGKNPLYVSAYIFLVINDVTEFSQSKLKNDLPGNLSRWQVRDFISMIQNVGLVSVKIEKNRSFFEYQEMGSTAKLTANPTAKLSLRESESYEGSPPTLPPSSPPSKNIDELLAKRQGDFFELVDSFEFKSRTAEVESYINDFKKFWTQESGGKFRFQRVKFNLEEDLKHYWSFYKFWKVYGKSTEKQKAYLEWRKSSKTKLVSLFKSLEAYIAANPDKQFRMSPYRYIREGYENEIIKQEQQKLESDAYERRRE